MALQRMGEASFPTLRELLSSWQEGASHLEQRAVMAALAHPPTLADPEVARYSLGVSDRILAGIASLGPEARKAEEYRVLRQGLEYALSVFVAALPGEGFPFLERWAASEDPDARRIVRSNLGKARLTKKFPAEVAAVQAAAGRVGTRGNDKGEGPPTTGDAPARDSRPLTVHREPNPGRPGPPARGTTRPVRSM